MPEARWAPVLALADQLSFDWLDEAPSGPNGRRQRWEPIITRTSAMHERPMASQVGHQRSRHTGPEFADPGKPMGGYCGGFVWRPNRYVRSAEFDFVVVVFPSAGTTW